MRSKTKQMSTDEFLQKYKELEQLVLERYPVDDGSSPIWALGDVREFVVFRPQLTAIREIRNFLSHQPSYEGKPMIVPTEAAIKIVTGLITKIAGPTTVYNICIKSSGILSAKMHDQVIPMIKLMADRDFHIVPVLENGKVVGVFSDSAKVVKDVDVETTFFQLKKYIDLDQHINKDILFLSKNESIDAAKEKIAEFFAHGNRISAIFITETGKPTEALIGLLLPLQLV